MKNKKGQALIEFVILLPIFLFLFFGVIDVGKIILTKNRLENELGMTAEELQKNKSVEEIQKRLKKENDNIELELKTEEKEIHVILKEKISIITPGLNLIFKPPYEVKVESWIPHES